MEEHNLVEMILDLTGNEGLLSFQTANIDVDDEIFDHGG